MLKYTSFFLNDFLQDYRRHCAGGNIANKIRLVSLSSKDEASQDRKIEFTRTAATFLYNKYHISSIKVDHTEF